MGIEQKNAHTTFKLTFYFIYENWSSSIGLTVSELIRNDSGYKGPLMFTKLRGSTPEILYHISLVDITTRSISYDCIINLFTVQWLRKISISFSHLHVCELGGIAWLQVGIWLALDPAWALASSSVLRISHSL